MSTRLSALIAQANEIIGEATPLPADCGRLCGAACCQGDDEMGMLLFPGEAVRLGGVQNFRLFRVPYMGGRSWLLTCDGTCERHLRPLSCRIFPLAPFVDEAGRVSAVPDPRARRMCPLADGTFLDARFRKKVTKALQFLSHEPKMLEFMKRVSEEVEELGRLV